LFYRESRNPNSTLEELAKLMLPWAVAK
jgi:hypothetical protein